MLGRLTQNDVTNQVNVEEPAAVLAAIRTVFEQRYPGESFEVLDRVFNDVLRLFSGRMPGYLPCDTLYHDMRHTLDVTLAIARLIDGHDRVHSGADRLGGARARLGVITALLHDSGYIRRRGDTRHRHGAEYTRVHVSRSAEFLKRYLPQIGLGTGASTAARLVHFTGYEIAIDDIVLDNPLDRRLGHMLGSADLIAQMSDRLYLEKCRDYLYDEFVMAGLAQEQLPDGTVRVNFSSPEDLLLKTPAFHDTVVAERLELSFDRVHNYAAAHFDGSNPYLEQMGQHLSYLNRVIEDGELDRLRRRSISLSHPSSPEPDEMAA
ncbi:MAG TPA: hypothetical protein VMK05_05540 [Burkholderiales bacterium]|nr:hypothetical protein [Burkholderiales bacterium]